MFGKRVESGRATDIYVHRPTSAVDGVALPSSMIDDQFAVDLINYGFCRLPEGCI